VPQVAPSGVEIVVTDSDPQLISSSDISTVFSPIVNVDLVDLSQNLGGAVEICLKPDGDADEDNLCLGFLDSSLSPPEWVCEDSCLDETPNGLFCGTTTHFTNFALLLGGTGGSGCDSSSEVYITGKLLGDVLLVVGCFVLICCIGAMIILLGTFVPPIRDFILGAEGARIKKARLGQSAYVYSRREH